MASGLLVVVIGPGWIFAVDGVTFLISAAALGAMRLPRPHLCRRGHSLGGPTPGTFGTATFGFTIPAGFPGLSGLPIVISVVDGGTPGTAGDTYGHGVGTCGGATGNYVITSGNLVVH